MERREARTRLAVILNFLTVIYALIGVLALALAVPAAVVGSLVAWGWKTEHRVEGRHELEKRVYLVITLMAVGLSLRLALVPLWFLTLSSLVSHVPGAMCLAGVHMLDSPWSFVASSLKVVVPLIYGYWLVLNALDRRTARQPLMGLKLLLLAPIALLLIVESGLDLHVLASVEPRSVSCCTSLFDMPKSDLARAVSSSTSVWVWMFSCLGAAAIGLSTVVARRPTMLWRVLLVVAASGATLAFPLALHSKLSPILLHAPFHHCIFCVIKLSVDVPVACALVICGAWLAVVAGILPSRVQKRAYRAMLTRLLTGAAALLASGMTILAVRTVMAVMR
jgi:hypothetical protein